MAKKELTKRVGNVTIGCKITIQGKYMNKKNRIVLALVVFSFILLPVLMIADYGLWLGLLSTIIVYIIVFICGYSLYSLIEAVKPIQDLTGDLEFKDCLSCRHGYSFDTENICTDCKNSDKREMEE